ncbi:MAG: hypothetical protein KC420_04205 [Myxococcales bacterium]|nr:hypothetical protein [Myxococcales bacterium]MCB9567810.1 hypothetical protein [Myxococcales bacterium]
MRRPSVILAAFALQSASACFTDSPQLSTGGGEASTSDADTSGSDASGGTTTTPSTTADASSSSSSGGETSGVAPTCGDGVVDPGEACDDGNQSDADACLSGCVAASCGDGFVWVGQEACDLGEGNDAKSQGGCRLDCALPACGDGAIYAGALGPSIALGQGKGISSVDLNHESPRAVAIDGAGRAYVVTDWFNANLGTSRVVIERYDPDGSAVGGPIDAYSGPLSTSRPVIAAAPDGRFIVAWQVAQNSDDIRYSTFNAEGVGGPIFSASESTSGSQRDPAVAINAQGDALIAFRASGGLDPGKWLIRTRRVPAAGLPPPDFVAGDSFVGDVTSPAIDLRDDGAFALAYSDDTGRINVRTYDGPGALTSAFEVDDGATSINNSNPWVGVAALSDTVVIAATGADAQVHLFTFDGSGKLVTSQAASTEALGAFPRIDLVADASDNVLVAWAGCGPPGLDQNCKGDPASLYLRWFYADGEPFGPPLLAYNLVHWSVMGIGVATNAIGDLALVAQDDNNPFLAFAPAACP